MADKIFGYDWEDIKRAQQGGRLSRPVIPATRVEITDCDRALLREHGSIEALEAAGFAGAADRFRRAERSAS